MVELLTLLSVGIALSMDTFSLSLSIGTLSIKSHKILQIAIIVGIMHFLMPLLGSLIGKQILNILPLNPNYLVSIILLFIAIMMIKNIINDINIDFDISLIGILGFALSVSFDSFTTGIGLKALASSPLVAGLIFAICSFTFTFIGLTIGKYSKAKLGKYATILGIILLFIVAFSHIFC